LHAALGRAHDIRNLSGGLRRSWPNGSSNGGATWTVNRDVLNRGANFFELQFWVGGPDGWFTTFGTYEASSGNAPAFLRLERPTSCARMIATRDDGPILGSGTSGNEPPCT
jgi:hypothetical protein